MALDESTENGAPKSERQVPLTIVVTYAAPAMGVGFMFFLVNMYLMKFSTDVLLIAPGAMGLIFGLSRIWDAISDPLAGYLSDRTRTRLGRRRPWLLASTLPIVVVYTMVWNPPASFSEPALVAWMAFGVLGFYTAVTIFSVPHSSLGAELSPSYDDRNRIFGWRHLGFISGAFLAVYGMKLLIDSSEPRLTAWSVSVTAALVGSALILFSALRLREPPENLGRGGTSPYAAFGDVWKNPHARLLLAVVLIEHLGSATITILTPYVSEYIIGRPDWTPIYIFCYMIASASTVLIWVRLAVIFGKKPLWMLSLMISGLSFGAMFLGGPGDVVLISCLATLAGVGSGCGAAVAPSIQADVIDYDEYTTGQRKEGAYYAAFSFVFKGAAGVTLMLTGFVLQLSGFQPNVEQTESAKLAMRSLFSLYPLLSCTVGAILISRFRLNRAEHQQIREVLDARRAAKSGPP